jgi:hypothetical protein
MISLLEVLIATAIFTTAVIPMLYVVSTGQRLGRAQPEASDLQQRLRVAVDKLQRDLSLAGGGALNGAPIGSLSRFVAPIVPARTGSRAPDPALAVHADRITILYVPDGALPARLSAAMATPADTMRLDLSSPACAHDDSCRFAAGQRALVVDTRALGAGHDVFTVTDVLKSSGVETELTHDPPNVSLSQPYSAGSTVVPVVQRVFHFDRATRRLMSYDGYQSDMPLVDHVADVRFEYFGDPLGGPGLEPLTLTQLGDGPGRGVGPLRFDEDLLRIRLVRVTLRLEAAADDVRGAGALFSRPGRSTSAFSLVSDYEVTLDVMPQNMFSMVVQR